MMNSEVEKACAEVLKKFKTSADCLVRLCGATWSEKYSGWMYVSSLGSTEPTAHLTLYVDILGEPFQFRLNLEYSASRLCVGWGSGNLLTTNGGIENERAIHQHCFIADVFRHEAAWRDLLSAMDLSEIIRIEERIKQEEVAAMQAEREANLKVFDEAGIKVGTIIETSQFGVSTVTRVGRDKIWLGHREVYKTEVGKRLFDGKWKVR